MALILYGIPNCTSVKKARDSLTQKNIPHQFHDFKKAALAPDLLRAWLQTVPLDVLVNKKGTTWRGLPEATKDGVTSATSATKLMIENSSVIKRPVLCKGKTVLVGFDADTYEEHLL
jgi:arsenate reductase